MAAETMWAVTHGSYSDYTVLCVCPSKDVAERVAAKIKGAPGTWNTSPEIQEFHVATDDTQPVDILTMRVELWDDGTESDYRETRDLRWPWDWGYTPDLQWRWWRASIHQRQGGTLLVSGSDHERVRRVFSDRRAQVKSEDAFRLKNHAQGMVK